MRALTTSATGLQAQQHNIDRIANDLANVNTDGYKRGRHEFEELMVENIKAPGAALGEGSTSPVGVQIGMGVKTGSIHRIFDQGPMKTTYRDYDLLIDGNGFFQLQLPDGRVGYTRRGNFFKNPNGVLTLNGGGTLVPQITVPQNTKTFAVKPSGEVIAVDDQGQENIVGQLQVTTFVNPQGLSTEGAGVYTATSASGAPISNVPGEGGAGSVMQGALEGSNVNVATSMVDMISTQRAYEMNTKVMSTVDNMMRATAGIKQ